MSTNHPPPDTPLLFIASLKYALAGDMEAVDLLNQLEARARAVNWDDPEFKKFTEEMRAGVAIPAVPELDLQSLLKATVHHQSEGIAERDEALRRGAKALESSGEFSTAAGAFIGDLLKQRAEMLDQLRLLDAETSHYVLSIPPILLGRS